MSEIAVAGIGNVLMGDDAAGPYVVELLRCGYDFSPHVEILDLGTPGMDLAGYLASYRAVILVDTVRAPAEPGAVVRYEKSSLMEDFASLRLSPHDPAVAQSLFLAELTAQTPDCVVLIGIVPQTIGLGEAMSPAARRGCSIASESVLVELARWGVAAIPKDCRTEARVWWELQPKIDLPFLPAAMPVQTETCARRTANHNIRAASALKEIC